MTKAKPLPSQERLHQLFYCVNGVFYRKIVQPGRNGRVGDIPGCIRTDGYRVQCIDGSQYKSHRLVWKYYFGTEPPDVLDHIDRNRGNNNIMNLRESTPHLNMCNRTDVHDNHNGIIQVIKVDGKQVFTEYGREQSRMRNRGSYHRNKKSPEEMREKWNKAYHKLTDEQKSRAVRLNRERRHKKNKEMRSNTNDDKGGQMT